MADSNSEPGDDFQSSIRGSSSTSDDISVPPFFNTTFSTHRVSPLYIGWRELDQSRLDELAHRLRDTLVGDVVRGIQITLESADTPAGQVGALRYVRMSWFDVDELLGDQDNSEDTTMGAGPAVSFDGQNRGLWIEIRHDNAAYVALLLPGYSTNPEIIQRPDPSFTLQDGAVPLDPQLEEQRFMHLPLLLLRMPMALKGVISEWLSSTFDCRVSKLSLGTRTLVNVWEGWIETYGVSSRGPDFTVTFSFNAPLPPKAGSNDSESDSDSEMDLDMTGQTTEAGLRSMNVAVSPQDLRRFIRAGERLGAEHITTKALWETNARERHRIAGGNLDDGWAWRKTDSGDHPFTEALGRYVHHHFGLNMFHPAVRIIQISCGSFVLAQSRLKIVRYGEITEDFSRAAWMFATKLGDRIRGDELPTAISSG